MMVPRILFGMAPTVRKRVRKLVHGRPWASTEPEWRDLVDVSAQPKALLLLDQTDRSMPGEHFHLYWPFQEAFSALDFCELERWANRLLGFAWGTAGFMS